MAPPPCRPSGRAPLPELHPSRYRSHIPRTSRPLRLSAARPPPLSCPAPVSAASPDLNLPQSQDCGRGGVPRIHRRAPGGKPAALALSLLPPPLTPALRPWLPSLAPTSALPRPALFLILRARCLGRFSLQLREHQLVRKGSGSRGWA
ncbi:unnamed protein product [Rangifer tarandus platyrhynchus]|uniref:Uncharacterized protein n=2 Tax=Rangifer tarandus platyrhynchus TaxID=3082113 RepID=A0ACB0EID8_RANTA|nr:unnamed protein product [Rangifer tarandus platyrhynchus]CAI9700333.1 unnamed protein product [Rangifer tarandus platyrhynchus]